MSYDHELILISAGYQDDGYGGQIPVETETPVLCEELSVGRSEFYSAAQTGLRPDVLFRIHRFEYAGQRLVRYEDGVRYRVIRAYATGTEEIELTCERAEGDG